MMRYVSILWLGLCLLLPFRAEAYEIAGTKVYCPHNVIQARNNLGSEGINDGVGHIYLNSRLLKQLPPPVRLFVFYHECGHSAVGGSELLADCWAINMGYQMGWLKEETLPDICASWRGASATKTHPSAVTRCNNIYQCFKGLTTKAKDGDKKEQSSAYKQ